MAIKANVSKTMKTVATRKQINADFDGGESIFPSLRAILIMFKTAVMTPPTACPWNNEPIYSGGKSPARAAKEPYKYELEDVR